MNPLDLIGNTRLLYLRRISEGGADFFLKLESDNLTGSIKDRPALAMIKSAIKSGKIEKGSHIIEATSGNTGISLAALAIIFQMECTAVVPETATQERVDLLESYRAHIIQSPGGSNEAVFKTKEIVNASDKYVHLDQYENEANLDAHYFSTAPEIIKDFPQITHFVAGLGTGGTLTGTGRRLKEYNPKIKIIGSEPSPEDSIYGLRSLEAGYIPPIFDISVLDRKILIPSEEAIFWTREILKKEGLMVGISTGANLAAAIKIAKSRDQVLIISPDGGDRYISTGIFKDGFDTKTDVYGLW